MRLRRTLTAVASGDDPYGAEYYAANGQEGDRPALRLYARIARRHLGRGLLLDFGCGTGHLLRRLAAKGPAAGLEVHRHGADAAARLVPSATVYRGLDEVPDGSFDGLVSIHVVEHVPDPELAEVLAGWRRILRPGGRALVVTPDVGGRAHQLKGERWSAFADTTHVNLKTHEQWQAFLHEHDFDLVRAAADGLWDFPYTPGRPRLVDAALRAWPTAWQFARGDLVLRPGRGEAVLMVVQAR
jgi:SAM-dependent methyltransferase